MLFPGFSGLFPIASKDPFFQFETLFSYSVFITEKLKGFKVFYC